MVDRVTSNSCYSARALVGRVMLKNKLGERVHLAVSGELVSADDRICLGPSSPPIRRSSGH